MAKGSEREKEKKRKKGAPKLTAKTADRHVLYQVAVQAPDFEVELLDSHFKRRVGRKPVSLREDFCGTALLCSEWVKSDEARTATGIDIDESVLAWGREHNLGPLGEAASRVALVRGDVRERRPEKPRRRLRVQLLLLVLQATARRCAATSRPSRAPSRPTGSSSSICSAATRRCRSSRSRASTLASATTGIRPPSTRSRTTSSRTSTSASRTGAS
ncbi:MAG: class I SAM-dependent methyltransferase [Sandaracinaceae bacterium]|nr:class I SAM-dependent methyltransferase [Sandaracinaceae bacterium]